MKASKQVCRQRSLAMRGTSGAEIRIRGISPSRRKVIRISAFGDRCTPTAMDRTASEDAEGWMLRLIQCSTVITDASDPCPCEAVNFSLETADKSRVKHKRPVAAGRERMRAPRPATLFVFPARQQNF